MSAVPFSDLPALAKHLRDEEKKKFVVLYAYNGTGKTRLSGAFKDHGKKGDDADTLYFNAFTEDLFYWDNDLENDRERVLKMNAKSRFFDGLREVEMNNLIRPIIRRYADFDFQIEKVSNEVWEASFSRDVLVGDRLETFEDIKISRGEENIFIWCFFLATVELVLDPKIATYDWVKYIYIDDPISSLDDNNVVMVAHHLAQMLTASSNRFRVVVSSHHVLFFNVMCNELKKSRKYFLAKDTQTGGITVAETDSTPFLYHLASLVDLHEAQRSGTLYTHHFNIMRRVMEQTACFFGYERWDECIRAEDDDPHGTVYKRVIDLMSHGDYSLYEPREMMPENKDHFRRVLRQFIKDHPFNPALFPSAAK